jgi:hypothetical protein
MRNQVEAESVQKNFDSCQKTDMPTQSGVPDGYVRLASLQIAWACGQGREPGLSAPFPVGRGA